MSDHWEKLDAAAIRVAADMTWRQHQPGGNIIRPGTCPQCTPDGCLQLEWSIRVRGGGPEALPVEPASVVPILLASANGRVA